MNPDDKTRILPEVTNATVGTQLSGIYELDERIASGGMGEVYRGHNIQTGDHVAIKIVLPEFARDQTILSLFRKEASILNHLSHDAIVRYHVFTIDAGIGRPYLAMEFVDGESLFGVMRRGAMRSEDVRKLCHRLASGLSAVHQAGAVHRDLSPDNVILPGGKVERAKIIDFGIARSATVGGETLIGGRFAGKYNYVSPEQLGLYGGEVTERSDIYSLGLVLAAALRGKPLDMSGSQFEVVEKRRTVPDLSGIDDDSRPMIEAMLQPNPEDRPASMAEIARMTRDETPTDIGRTAGPQSAMSRDRQLAWPQTEAPAASAYPWGGTSPSAGQNASVPPSKEAEEPRFVPHKPPAHLSQPRPAAAMAPSPAATAARPANTRNIAIAALAALIVVSGGGAYLGGLLTPSSDSSASDTGATSERSPDLSSPSPENTASGNQPAENGVPPQARTEEAATPSGNPPGTASSQGQTTTQQAGNATDSEATTEQAPTPSAGQTDTAGNQARETAQPGGEIADSGIAAEEAATPPAGQTTPPNKRETGQPAGSGQGEVVIATNVPKPDVPVKDAIDEVAERISWLRDYRGGDCFYATATSVTDKAIDIEGFGTTAEPFMQMLEAFDTKFDIQPEVGVRLIEPAQCEVTGFLRVLGATAAEKPALVLDRTSVPNGSPVSGTLETLGGLRSNLLLIDHKGMAFNLDARVTMQAGKAAFSIPIGLGPADRAAGKPVPQIIIAVTGASDIQAAAFSNPTPAAVVLPKILAEIQEKGLEFSATAKYFQLGG